MDKLVDPKDLSVPPQTINNEMIDGVLRVLQIRFKLTPPSTNDKQGGELDADILLEIYSATLIRYNNLLMIARLTGLQGTHPIKSPWEVSDLWKESMQSLHEVFRIANIMKQGGLQQLINGNALINGFYSTMNVVDFVCRKLSDPQVGPTLQARNGLYICSHWPRFTDDFLADMKALNLIFYLPVAAKSYRQNFLLLAQLDDKSIESINSKSDDGDWSRAMAEQGTKAESAYLALFNLNAELYRAEYVSFLREEAAYYKKAGSIEKSAAILRKVREIDPDNLIVGTPGDVFGWINYVN